MSELEIARTSPSELADLPDDFWSDAVVVEPVAKRAISLRVDEDVLAWFKASGPRISRASTLCCEAIWHTCASTDAAGARPNTRLHPPAAGGASAKPESPEFGRRG